MAGLFRDDHLTRHAGKAMAGRSQRDPSLSALDGITPGRPECTRGSFGSQSLGS